MKIQSDEFYTPYQIAQILDIDPRTVRKYVRDGHIEAFIFPSGHFKIMGTSVEKFLLSCRESADSIHIDAQ